MVENKSYVHMNNKKTTPNFTSSFFQLCIVIISDGSTSSLQAVTSDVRAVSDGDSSTVWARKITPGYDTTIMFTFRKPVKVSKFLYNRY